MTDWTENPKTKSQEIRYSRYIASWRHVVDKYSDSDKFEEWLKTQNLTDNEIIDILEMYKCGKFELEENIRKYLKAKKEES